MRKTGLREVWLQQAAEYLIEEHMRPRGVPCSPVRVSCGWPSHGGVGRRSRVVGQCFPPERCADGIPQLFISPVLSESVPVLGTLLHELVHAAVGCEKKHGKVFSQAGQLVGLVGKPTEMDAGEGIRPLLTDYVARSGAYPHAAIAVRGQANVSLPAAGDEAIHRAGSRLRLFECDCQPPVKVRAARDALAVQCTQCNEIFHLIAASRGKGELSSAMLRV
jgi:hypothetical protein